MRTAKENKHVKKRTAEANKTAKTDASRKRRLANKAIRDDIHAIDPDMKVSFKNQVAYNEYGNKVEVIDGKIVSSADVLLKVLEATSENVIGNIQNNNKSAIERLTDKLRRNK